VLSTRGGSKLTEMRYQQGGRVNNKAWTRTAKCEYIKKRCHWQGGSTATGVNQKWGDMFALHSDVSKSRIVAMGWYFERWKQKNIWFVFEKETLAQNM
jgi:hypothetical protein